MKQILESTFWTDLLKNGQSWLINEMPGLLIALVLFFIAFKIINFSLKKLEKILLNRADKNDKLDTGEAEKRILT
ncbi:MAG: mechanosensitive ion channel family protein, partial [Candidatus Cloacimonetes bacterium]|nr:mechanosensitive ion channel family protein [Candidatus Cloacimonadota bacterium]